MSIDYYRILQITRSVTITDINNAYRRLALKYHPKRSLDPNAIEIFAWTCEAYDVLSQNKLKAIFDQYGAEGLTQGIPLEMGGEAMFTPYSFHGDCEKVFNDFFGLQNPYEQLPDSAYGGFGKGLGNRMSQGGESQIELQLSLEEMYLGCIKKISLTGNIFDPEGKPMHFNDDAPTLEIKPGCPIDREYVFPKQASSAPGVLPGDAALIVKAIPHDRFVRDGNDLIYKTDIHLANALTGIVLEFLTLDNRLLHFPITDVVNPGYRKIVPGEGMPLEEDPDKYGDLLIEFDIIFPKSISPQQIEILRKALSTPLPDPSVYPRNLLVDICS